MQLIVTMPADNLQDSASPVEEQGNFRQDYGGSAYTLYNSRQYSFIGANEAHMFGKVWQGNHNSA
jgi:hypothetical protein